MSGFPPGKRLAGPAGGAGAPPRPGPPRPAPPCCAGGCCPPWTGIDSEATETIATPAAMITIEPGNPFLIGVLLLPALFFGRVLSVGVAFVFEYSEIFFLMPIKQHAHLPWSGKHLRIGNRNFIRDGIGIGAGVAFFDM